MPQRPFGSLEDDDPLVAGTRLGPYEIVSPLGAGGMGEVYRAIDTRLGREVAVKILGRSASAMPSQRRRFDREAQLASAVNHPHVLTVFDVGESRGVPYVVTELLEGQTLRARLRPGLLPVREAVGLATQIARGLDGLHARGIVHRDLKPENLFVTEDGRIKILDLGLAGLSPDGDRPDVAAWDVLTTEGASAFGTAAYMSPEQVRRRPADPKSDIFACGVVVYEMLAGRRPFSEETAVETMTAILRTEPVPLLELAPTLPPALVRVVERCLEKRPESRFHSAHDLALALEAAVAAPPPLPPAPTPSPSAPVPSAAAVTAVAPDSRSGRRGFFTLSLGLLAMAAGGLLLQEPGPGSRGFPAGGLTKAQGWLDLRAVLHAYDAAQGRFAPYLDGLSAEGVDFSRDGRFLVYTSYPDGVLWRSGIDGSKRRRLTDLSLRAALPRLSPDGRRVAFAGRSTTGPWKIHVVSVEGGSEIVLPPDHVTDPGWSPDGKSLVLGSATEQGPGTILRWDFGASRLDPVPGSAGLFSPRPSPDGRWLAGLRRDDLSLMLQDRSGAWARLTPHSAAYPQWTRDSAWLHFRRAGGGFARLGPLERREETVAEVGDSALGATSEWGAWSGLTPEGLPLLLLDLSKQSLAERSSQTASVEEVALTAR